jgi:hypothetical protein
LTGPAGGDPALVGAYRDLLPQPGHRRGQLGRTTDQLVAQVADQVAQVDADVVADRAGRHA